MFDVAGSNRASQRRGTAVHFYRPVEPVAVPKGTRIHCVGHFDNSKGNPNNPDPTREVFWGDQTWQEMMIGWLDLAYDRK